VGEKTDKRKGPRTKKYARIRVVASNVPDVPAPSAEIIDLAGRKDARSMAVKRAAFLACIAKGHTIKSACEVAHVARSTVDAWKREDKEFLAAFRDAFEDGADEIEEALIVDAMKPGAWVAKLAVLKSRRASYRESHRLDVVIDDKPEEGRSLLKQVLANIKERQVAQAEQARLAAEEAAQRQSGCRIKADVIDAEVVASEPEGSK
jgi:hypothetical protein